MTAYEADSTIISMVDQTSENILSQFDEAAKLNPSHTGRTVFGQQLLAKLEIGAQ